MTPPRPTALTVLHGGQGQVPEEDLDDDAVLDDPFADPFAGRETDGPLGRPPGAGRADRADRAGRDDGHDDVGDGDDGDDPDDPDGEGRWLAARGRWGVPVLAAAALLVLAAVVALVLGVRAGALAPGDDAVTAGSAGVRAGSPGAAAGGDPAADAPATVERTGPVVGGAVDGPTREPGSAAAPGPAGTSGSGGPAGGPDPAASLTVHVVGAVVSPGVVTVPPGARAVDAVAAAGGTTPDADPAGVNLAAPLVDGQQVLVPRPGEAVPPAPAGGAPAGGGDPAAPAPLDVNTASAAELDALPGIGPVLAGRIVQTRDAHGPFAAVDELVEVPGIGDAVLERLRPLVRV